ncbi:Amino acid permease 6 [Heracleum sosnowskyi]|uniref:Amino acid permease 6 n=1 Tax=Heracleum sosnowskyi TaxID=360622 RepID=A0AAD8GNY6_9APIA|nr:Amino acid permease 6 [Heracleum sosnowskyi]
MSYVAEAAEDHPALDDDGRPRRTGTMVTAAAHIITSVIGSGVLSLAWAVAQLGWIAGSFSLFLFSLITLFTSHLLADCYRSSLSGKRNYSYMDVVNSNLGGLQIQLCGIAQYSLLFGLTIGYTIVTSTSIQLIKCGNDNACRASNNLFILIYGVVQIVLSQIPNFHKLTYLSLVAAAMSFAYSFIGIALSLAKIIQGNGHFEKSLAGVPVGWKGQTKEDKIWNILSGMGDIAFAYAFSSILTNIQDTLKSSPPEKKVMKKATSVAILVTTVFYLLCGLIGYAAFGNGAPGNLLTGFSSFKPFWIVDVANICIIIHLVGAYQVICQPIYAFVEGWCVNKWPQSEFITREYSIRISRNKNLSFNSFRLVWRTVFVIVATVMAMVFPFFNQFVGLLGAITFWPMTVYFPVEMYIAQRKIKRFTRAWNGLQILSFFCLIVSLLAAVGSVHGLVMFVQKYKPFQNVS